MKRLIEFAFIATAWLVAVSSIYALWNWPLWWLLGAVVLFVATFVSYGFLMLLAFIIEHGQSEEFEKLVKVKVKLSPEVQGFGFVALYTIGYPLDFLLNAAVFTVLLVWPPFETTVTERLKKHVGRDDPLGSVARYFARVWVNPLDLRSMAEGRLHVDMDVN
jgi:hypothetical protein